MTKRTILSILATLLLAGGVGCERGVKLGNGWLVRPTSTAAATDIHLTRYEYAKGADRGEPSVLEIDLFTGRALLNEPDGRAFPSQLSPQTTQNLRDIIAKKTYRTSRITPLRSAELIREYELTIYENDTKLAPHANWATPPYRDLMRPHTRMTKVFERAHRMAHPLSERVNLVE